MTHTVVPASASEQKLGIWCAYQVLTKPFDGAEVVRVLSSAWARREELEPKIKRSGV